MGMAASITCPTFEPGVRRGDGEHHAQDESPPDGPSGKFGRRLGSRHDGLVGNAGGSGM